MTVTPELVYWVAVTAIGTGAGLVSLAVGLTYFRGLHKTYPALVGSYWPEIVRDVLLVLALAGNLAVGLLSFGGSMQAVGLVAILGAVTCLSLFAVFNLALRIGR